MRWSRWPCYPSSTASRSSSGRSAREGHGDLHLRRGDRARVDRVHPAGADLIPRHLRADTQIGENRAAPPPHPRGVPGPVGPAPHAAGAPGTRAPDSADYLVDALRGHGCRCHTDGRHPRTGSGRRDRNGGGDPLRTAGGQPLADRAVSGRRAQREHRRCASRTARHRG